MLDTLFTSATIAEARDTSKGRASHLQPELLPVESKSMSVGIESRIPGIDLLRGLCIIAVVLYHTDIRINFADSSWEEIGWTFGEPTPIQ
jgi:hypothetical protein